MTVQEIKDSVDAGKTVHWKNFSYTIVKDKNGEYLISYDNGRNYIGLTWQDGVTLNGKEEDFYLGE